MLVNAIRCPASTMHATIRRFNCTACCCPPLMQIDGSLCTTRRPAWMSHPQLARFAGESPRELVGNARGGCCDREGQIGRPAACVAADRISSEWLRRSRRKVAARDACASAGSAAECAIDCRNNEQGEIVGGRCVVCRSVFEQSRHGLAQKPVKPENP